MNYKNALKYGLSLLLAIALLYWVFKDFDFNILKVSFEKANYFWVLLSALLGLIAHVSRAYRFKLMLEPLNIKLSTLTSTIAVLFGYLANLVLPRAGEIARASYLKKTDQIPFETSFGIIIAERVIDVLMLLFLFSLNLLLEYDRISDLLFSLFGEKLNNPIFLIGFGILFTIIAFIFYYLIKKYKRQLIKNQFINKIFELGKNLWNGLTSVFKLKRPQLFLFHTFLIWFLYYSMTYSLIKAFPMEPQLGFLGALSILTMGSFGMAAPTIGGLGSYHFLVAKIVGLYGYEQDLGISLATFLHTFQGLIFVLIFGLLAFLLNISYKKNR